jgi:hypothetical protein
VQRLLSSKTEASKERQAQPRASLAQGSLESSEVPGSAMETASETARLILEMRDRGAKAGSNGKRLELVAEHFLRIGRQGPAGTCPAK